MSYVNAIGTATPPLRLEQTQIADFMANALRLDADQRRKLLALYRTTRIQHRHTVLADYGAANGAFSFFPNTPDLEPFPTVAARMEAYRQYAAPLAEEAVRAAIAQHPDFQLTHVTHLLTVSCTGMYAPGLDIELVEQLGLPTQVQRTAINFMGCYGAFNALKLADTICRAEPDARVLVVCVELCSLHFQKSLADDHLLSNALFADGAAAVLVEATPRPGIALKMNAFHCDLMLAGKSEMAWHIADFGFEMTLSSYVPALVERGIRQLIDRLLVRTDLEMHAVHHFAIHPGGRRILEVIEQQLGLSTYDNRHAYRVLRDYGNMSSPTVLFVLAQLWQELDASHGDQNILSCAFGPGLTLESMAMSVVITPAAVHNAAAVPETADFSA